MKLIETMKIDLHAVRTRGLRILVVVTAALALVACSDDRDNEDVVIEPVDNTAGAVFTMSNAREGNVVVAFSRASDGTLTEAGRFPTGGTGSGSFEDTSNSMILGNAQGESAPNNLIAASSLLFVTYTKNGLLLTTEQFDGPLGPSRGAVASYQVAANGTLIQTSVSVHNGGTDSCWFVVTDDGRTGFTTSFFEPNNPDQPFPESDQNGSRISSYRINPDGSLELLDPIAFDPVQGASDLALSRDSSYLYQLNSFEGTINAFEVGSDGSLTPIDTVQAFPPSDAAARIGLSAS